MKKVTIRIVGENEKITADAIARAATQLLLEHGFERSTVKVEEVGDEVLIPSVFRKVV